ncbi:GntR family transcriptional regulator [Clostridium sp. UBA6640]|uniref:GntR family transcriptional regulator n=1 Tax=Clostridium sp. UBA6640 TaxID=1946370 RepID=UPI0025C6030E|nr:GntR family transcriptional regulator [Clostridium sp. UBA6640]
MKVEFDNNIPIYLQIMNIVKKQIIRGEIKEGDKIPSVREFAEMLQINPNTVQRTFQELEREGIVITKRGMGRYVTEDSEKIMEVKQEMSKEIITNFLNGMKSLGFEEEEILKIVLKEIKKEN